MKAIAGLTKIKLANVGLIVCIFVSAIPGFALIGAAMAIAFSILNIVGTFEIGERFPRCIMAAQLTFVIMLLSLGTNFIISEQIIATMATVLISLVRAVPVFIICYSVSKEIDDTSIRRVGVVASILLYVYYALAGVSALFSLLEELQSTMLLVDLAISLLYIVGLIFYVSFISKAKKEILSEHAGQTSIE